MKGIDDYDELVMFFANLITRLKTYNVDIN